MNQTLIPLSSRAEWKKALSNVPHAFGHTWENCHAMQLSSGLDTYLYHFSDKDVHIVCPISERKFMGNTDILTPYGFSGFAANKDHTLFHKNWSSFVSDRNYVCGYIGLNSILEQKNLFPNEKIYSHNNLFALDLTLTEDQLLNNFSPGRRAQIKNHNDQLTTFTQDKPILMEFFLKNYYDFFVRLNAHKMLDFTPATLSNLLESDNVILTGKQNNGKIEAVSVFGYTPYIAAYLHNISLPEGRHHAVPLLWQGIMTLKQLGIPVLNLGGGVSKDDSIAKFKERFGAHHYPLSALKQIYNPGIFRDLCKQAGVDSTDLDGYFPQYHRF